MVILFRRILSTLSKCEMRRAPDRLHLDDQHVNARLGLRNLPHPRRGISQAHHRDPYLRGANFSLFFLSLFGSNIDVPADSGIDYGVQRAIDVTRFAVSDPRRALSGAHQKSDEVDSVCEFATLRADLTDFFQDATPVTVNIFRNDDQSRMGVTDNIPISVRIPNSRPSRSHFA